MATVLNVITEALITVKALAVGETVPAAMANNGLRKFNDVLEALSIQNLAIYSRTQTTFPLVAGQAQYTIGPGGNVSIPRPTGIEIGYVTYQGVDFPVDVTKTDEEYALLDVKNTPGIPQWAVYDAAFPVAVLTLWPVPYQPATMTFYQNKPFTAAGALTDTFTMPPGYNRMIRLMLAWELVNDYPGLGADEVGKLGSDGTQALALVKRKNQTPQLLRSEVSDLECSGGGCYVNWRNGA